MELLIMRMNYDAKQTRTIVKNRILRPMKMLKRKETRTRQRGIHSPCEPSSQCVRNRGHQHSNLALGGDESEKLPGTNICTSCKTSLSREIGNGGGLPLLAIRIDETNRIKRIVLLVLGNAHFGRNTFHPRARCSVHLE